MIMSDRRGRSNAHGRSLKKESVVLLNKSLDNGKGEVSIVFIAGDTNPGAAAEAKVGEARRRRAASAAKAEDSRGDGEGAVETSAAMPAAAAGLNADRFRPTVSDRLQLAVPVTNGSLLPPPLPAVSVHRRNALRLP